MRQQAWLEYSALIRETGRKANEADFLAGWISGQSEAREVLSEVRRELKQVKETLFNVRYGLGGDLRG